MSERPTQTPAPSAPEAQASRATERDGLRIDERRSVAQPRPQQAESSQSLAARAERFRNGAPFLVERATLFDPDPLDLPIAPAQARARSPHSLLPAALTLLGVVVVVGLAAGVLFVRNADVPRGDEARGRLEQFSERLTPRPTTDGQSHGRDPVTYDLTRRSNDTIIGAWRSAKEIERSRTGAGGFAAPDAGAAKLPPIAQRRPLPRRFSVLPAEPTAAPVAKAVVPQRAPLDDPYVSKASAEGHPVAPPPDARDTAAVPQQSQPDAATHPGANIVARVGRAKEPVDEEKDTSGRDVTPPKPPREPDAKEIAQKRLAARRAQRAELRRKREARRRAVDLDRFLLRDRGDIPNGFSFWGLRRSGPDAMAFAMALMPLAAAD